MKQITWVVLGGLILVAIIFGSHFSNVDQASANYPKINPNPVHIFNFRGTIDPKLHLQFLTHWGASNESCYYWLSFIEGAKGYYSAALPVTYTLNHDHFDIPIATDGVLPGRCGWKFGGISLVSGSYVVQTNSPPLGDGHFPNGKQDFNCVVRSQQQAYSSCPPTGRVLWWYPETTDLEGNFLLGNSK
jgi:hypothetical protein